jgi:hypothetical protein
MNETVVLHMDGQWFLFEEDTIHVVQEYPRLETPAVVLTDFGGALSGVSALDGRSDYAEALIGRRLRDEGQIDGEARILVHRRVRESGGFQCLYTAIPIDIWRRMQSWAENQKEHCLLLPQTAAMLRLAPKGDNGVIFRCGRRVSLLIQRREGLNYFSVLSLSDNREDLLACVGTLARRFPNRSLDPARGASSLAWFSLSGSEGFDEDEELRAAFSEASGFGTTRAPTQTYRGENGNAQAALSALRPAFSESASVNPFWARYDYFSEKRLTQAGCCAGLAALAFVLFGAALLWQAAGIDARTAQNRERAQSIVRDLQGGGSPVFPANRFHATRDLVDQVASAQSGVDPYSFLRNLRLAAGEKVKLLRVSVGKEIIVEGWVDPTGGDDKPLAGFVTQLRRDGFSTEAIDTSSTLNTRRPGFFAYRLSASRIEGGGS